MLHFFSSKTFSLSWIDYTETHIHTHTHIHIHAHTHTYTHTHHAYKSQLGVRGTSNVRCYAASTTSPQQNSSKRAVQAKRGRPARTPQRCSSMGEHSSSIIILLHFFLSFSFSLSTSEYMEDECSPMD